MDQHSHAWSCGNQGHRNLHAGLRHPPMCARYAVVPTQGIANNCYNAYNWYNWYKTYKLKWMLTLARSHIFNPIPKQGPALSAAIIEANSIIHIMFSIPKGEGPQCTNVGGCLPRCSHPKLLVPTQKHIGNAYENDWRIDYGRASVITVMLFHFVTE